MFPGWRDPLDAAAGASEMRAPKCLKCGGEHWSREPCAKIKDAPGLKTVAVLEGETHDASGIKYGSHVVVQEFPKMADGPNMVGGNPPPENSGSCGSSEAGSNGFGYVSLRIINLSPEAEALKLKLERVSGLKVRLFDPAKTRAYNRVYMAARRAGGKPKKKGGAK